MDLQDTSQQRINSINSKLPPKRPSKIEPLSIKPKRKEDKSDKSSTQTGSQRSVYESDESNSNDSDTESVFKESMTSGKEQNEESDYDSDEGFQEELSSDEEETFMQKFMSQTQNQIFLSIPNVEERGRKKNKIDPELPEIKKSYSLLPDMATGWRPKILTEQIPCPIPLYFGDKNLNMIANKLQRIPKYPIVYFGQKPRTSFDVHRQFCGKDKYSFKFSSILFNEDVLKQFKIKIQDETDTMEQIENLRIFAGMNPDFKQNQLNFDSFFEGGNLDIVVKLSDLEYDMYMRPDTNSKGHQSWFHFKISNTKANQTIRFNICNFQKKRSLYSRGLKPYVLSKKDKEQFGQVWKQGGFNVYYSKRKNIKYDMLINSSKPYYQMTFDYTFEYDGDEVYFAALPPYTYSDMRSFLTSDIITQNKQYVREAKLCRSLGGLLIPQINITDYESDEIAVEQRKTFIISARIHPGESISSYIAEGVIQYLLSDDEEVKELRKKVIFRVIPVLNVDGVIVGNYRTSFSGLDLNRQFSQSDRFLLPEVYHLKRIVRRDHNMNNLIAFFDIHGHSVRKNCFMYGPYFAKNELNYYKSKFIPYLFSLKSDTFRYKSCKFTNQNYKRETARLVFHKQFGVFNSFTLEASFGLKEGKNQLEQQYEIKDYLNIGKDLVTTLSDYMQKMEIFNKVKDNQEQIKLKMEMEKAMRSPAAKDVTSNKKCIQNQIKGNQAPLAVQHNITASNPSAINTSSIKSRKTSFSFAITERFLEDQSFSAIKTFIQGIKDKNVGKKFENESDRYSDAKIDSDDSEEDFADEARKGINDNILNCVQNFKKQFVKPEDPLQNAPKELVIVLSQPQEEDDKKKKKKKKTQNLKREEIKLSKQYKSKFQEDDNMQFLFEEVINYQKENGNSKKNAMKNINKFIKENYKEEEQQQPVILMPRIDAFGSGSKLLPSVQKNDNNIFNPYKEQSSRMEVSSALSGSIQLQTSQDRINNIFGKFYNDTEIKKSKNEKLDKSSISIPPKERSLTPINLSKGNNSSINNVNTSGLYQKNFQNRVQLKMNIICEKNDTIKNINDKMKNQSEQMKSMDMEKSTSILKQSQQMTSSIQNSLIFDKEGSLFDAKSVGEIPLEYTKGFSGNIHNSNKNPFYINNPVIKLKPESSTPSNKTVLVMNSQNISNNDTKVIQNLTSTTASIHPKRDSIFESQHETKEYPEDYGIPLYGNVLQNCTNQPRAASNAQQSSNAIHMPRLQAQYKNTSKSKEQINKRRSSQRKEQGISQNPQNQSNISQDLYNQLPPRDFKTDKKITASAKTPVLSSLKSSNIKKRESSLDLQVRPFSIQTNINNPNQKLEEVVNENEISMDNRFFKQYQAFQVRKNNSKLAMQGRIKNNNNPTHQSFML